MHTSDTDIESDQWSPAPEESNQMNTLTQGQNQLSEAAGSATLCSCMKANLPRLTIISLSLSCFVACRYQRGSEMCEKLAHALHHLTTEEERALFDFGSRAADENPLVLILDRKDDPVTPMLLQSHHPNAPYCLNGTACMLLSSHV